ncbi:hypothetical protein L5G28_09595 [Gordonia sp. HY285]|uniref:hypothetical protein n=1 Tax=Gordonia liuliyuniae TaxID=2911517 RepID=UPI001F200E6F|nr:hypothetical protein [Gordonia liuliyuniae]MCF8610408.1 hypothetical protein [Gordonia liuliyuniae]
MRFTRFASLVAAATTGMVLVAGCGGDDSSTASSSTSSSSCAGGVGEYFSATTNAGEPEIRIPELSGWTRISDFESEVARLTVADPSLTTDGYTANVVVSIEKSSMSGDAEFDRQMQGLDKSAVAGSVTRHDTASTCGYPSMLVDYQLQTPTQDQIVSTATSLVVSVPGEPTSTTVLVTVQTANPDDATYLDAKQKILNGVRVAA